MPDVDALVPGESLEILAQPLGDFEFKGSKDAISIVNVSPASLSGRKFPLDPPKGKGSRVKEPNDADPIIRAQVPLLKVVQQMKEAYLIAGDNRPEVPARKAKPSRRVFGMQRGPNRLGTLTEEDEDVEDRSVHGSRQSQSQRPSSLLRWGLPGGSRRDSGLDSSN